MATRLRPLLFPIRLSVLFSENNVAISYNAVTPHGLPLFYQPLSDAIDYGGTIFLTATEPGRWRQSYAVRKKSSEITN